MTLKYEEVKKTLDNVLTTFDDRDEEDKRETIETLHKMKDLATTTTTELASVLSEYRAILNKVNSTICELEGHSFGDWEEHERLYLDRSYYYDRICSVCGRKETTHEEPNEYVVQCCETGQVLRKTRGQN